MKAATAVHAQRKQTMYSCLLNFEDGGQSIDLLNLFFALIIH